MKKEEEKTHICSKQDENDADRGKYCRKKGSKQASKHLYHDMEKGGREIEVS